MILYKYCSWNRHTHDNLLESVLYFAAAAGFNDPLDMLPILNCDVTKAQVIQHMTKLFIRSGLRADEARKHAKYAATHDPSFSTLQGRQQMAQESMDGIRRTTGVCCFSSKNDIDLMWAHYADSYCGVCVEYNIPDGEALSAVSSNPKYSLMKIRPKKVIYTDTRPVVEAFSMDDDDTKFLNLFTKSRQWEYECEWRMITPDYIGKVHHKSQFLTGIILGSRISDQDEKAVRSLVGRLASRPIIYRARLNPQGYGLTIVLA